jgi:deazaflavin-dependent oxidoreductase (nitroreductase family)
MAYLKPAAFTQKIFNPIAMRFGLGGATRLTVPGRRSGEPQEIPVIPVEHEGDRYLVSTRGESAWVKNVRAAGAVTLGKRGKETELRVEELPVEARDPVIAAYRTTAGKTVEGYWKKLPDPADHPVFRLVPGA